MTSVDVIVPCYNYGRFLRECVESVLSQEGVGVRVLIIDDSSSDNTEEVGRELAAGDSRVEFRRHEKNRGNIKTYNEGLDWAKADYTLLLSADDMLLPGALSRAAALMDAHSEVGLVYGRSVVHLAGTPLPQPGTWADDGWQVCDGLQWLERLCLEMGDGIDAPTVVVRTALQHRLGGFREDLPYTGDIELWSRFALNSSVGVLYAHQAIYRMHGVNMHMGADCDPIRLLENRLTAFREAFASHLDKSPQVQQVEQTAYRTLARAALWIACKAFDQGETNSLPIKGLEEFALRASPQATLLREHAGLALRKRWGPRGWRLIRRAAFWKKLPRRKAFERTHNTPPPFLSLR